MNIEEAVKAAWQLVHGHRVVGLGSGTTIVPFIEAHNVYCPDSSRLVFVPTSLQAKFLLDRLGLVAGDLNSHPSVDITVDGCDAFTADGDLVKGGGACLLQEKMVAEASTEYVILAASRKQTTNLLASPVPLEVHPFAAQSVVDRIKARLGVDGVGGSVSVRCATSGKLGPVVTDSGNLIVDLHAGDGNGQDVAAVQDTLLRISGVLETGLFLNMHPTVISFE